MNGENFAVTTALSANPQISFTNTTNNMSPGFVQALGHRKYRRQMRCGVGIKFRNYRLDGCHTTQSKQHGILAIRNHSLPRHPGLGHSRCRRRKNHSPLPVEYDANPIRSAATRTEPRRSHQAASDNSTNVATDAFVKSNLPLAGTTGSIGGSSLALGACTSGTVSITGATTSMAVVASPTTYPGDGMVWRPYVSAAGTVTVKVCAAVAGTPTASTYNVRVIQ